MSCVKEVSNEPEEILLKEEVSNELEEILPKVAPARTLACSSSHGTV
jgi:hypothetical protein